jgi:hypothetical protein
LQLILTLSEHEAAKILAKVRGASIPHESGRSLNHGLRSATWFWANLYALSIFSDRAMELTQNYGIGLRPSRTGRLETSYLAVEPLR